MHAELAARWLRRDCDPEEFAGRGTCGPCLPATVVLAIYRFRFCGTNFGFCAPMPAPAPICAAGDIGRPGFAAGLPTTVATSALRLIFCFNVFVPCVVTTASVDQTPASS
jgi:hypothetical protein